MHLTLYTYGQIIPGYCKLREVSQLVRLGLLRSIIVKMLSQADQIPYWGRELAFWMGNTVIPSNRGI
jgi:hypothetical protein